MPYSDDTNLDDIAEYIRLIDPDSVLDVGAGAGKYGKLCRRLGVGRNYLDAVEVWEPYIKEFGLEGIYNKVYNEDIRDWPNERIDYELVIFGDIMEHMSKEDSVKVWEKINGHGLISIPIGHYPQGHAHGNPFEEHVEDHWEVSDVLDNFEGSELLVQTDITAVFIK